ncbi:ABC transporter permease subunit [Solwaraspora sp. WMMB335]|uniref:ABC transporter permease subunit n=1 Tax=Solwaraspora sp. WMMB335 TaxID=3404118 RepID=UPI003B961F56
MLLRNPFTKSLHDARRSLLGWALAIAGVGAMYASFWPTMQTPEMADAMAAYPQALLDALNFDDVTSPTGYLGSAVFGMLIPMLTAVFMIAAGTRAIAGDEDAGTLDLVLSHPVGRVRVALHRFGAVLIGIVLVVALLWLALAAVRGPADYTSVGLGRLAAMCLHLTLFGTVFGALAFAIGAATGSRAMAIGGSAAVAVLGYFANAVLPQVQGLEWARNLSPFHWYLGGDPLVNGVQAGGVLLLAGTTAVLVAVGTWRFTGRDIAV